MSFKKILPALLFLGLLFSFTFADERIDAASYLQGKGIITQDPNSIAYEEPISRKEAAIDMKRYAVSQGSQMTQQCSVRKDTQNLPERNELLEACKVGLFKQAANFYPYQNFTRGSLIIVLARFLNSNPWMELDESYDYLLGKGIIKVDDRSTSSRSAMRSDVYVMLYRIQGSSSQTSTATQQTTSSKFQIVETKIGEYSMFFPTYSPDRKHFAFTAQKRITGTFMVVKDGVEITNSNKHMFTYPTYINDGKSFAYLETDVTDPNQKTVIVKDGVVIPISISHPYTQIVQLAFSPDGKSYAFAACKDAKCIIVKDGIEITGGYSMNNWPTYSPDGKSFAFAGFGNRGWVIVKDGVEIPAPYNDVSQLIYSPDGKNFTYVANFADPKHQMIVKDGVEIPAPYMEVGSLAYSPDGKSFSFAAHKDTGTHSGEWLIVKDGVEKPLGNPRGSGIESMVYSLDGKKLIFFTEQNREAYSLDYNFDAQ